MDLLLIGVLGAIVLVIIAIVLWLILTYNSLISSLKKLENSWAQIDVQLKRRADLIPNLIETVKGYAKFERKVLAEVTSARTAILSAKTPKEAAKGENMLSGALKTVFAVAESYPALRANENFKALQEELASTENKVAYARQFYNDTVMNWNTKILQFPTSIVAGMFKMKNEKEFFQVEESAKNSVKADFSDLGK